jgi:hypothetical protein
VINTNETIQFWRAQELASYQVEISYYQYYRVIHDY